MKVKVKEINRILDEYFKVDRVVFQIEKFDGTMSHEIVRLNLDRGRAVAAIIYNVTNKTLIFVKQFRYPIYTNEPDKAWTLEIPAGMIESGISPEETMIREIIEETGYRVSHLLPLFSFYPTAGASNEKIYLFFSKVNKKDRVNSGGGLVEEGEDIQIVEIPPKQAFQMIQSGEIVDAKTIIALQWLKNRQKLLK